MAGVGVERHDIAGQVGRALVAVQAQVRDVLAPVFLDQPSCRSVEPVLLLLGGRIGPPFGRSRQQDLDGDDAVRPAALASVIHRVQGGDEGGGVGGGIIGADEDAVHLRPTRVGVGGRDGAGHMVRGRGQCARRLDLFVTVDGKGHGSLPFRNDGGLGFSAPTPQGVGVADGRTNETNGNGRGAPLKFV